MNSQYKFLLFKVNLLNDKNKNYVCSTLRTLCKPTSKSTSDMNSSIIQIFMKKGLIF